MRLNDFIERVREQVPEDQWDRTEILVRDDLEDALAEPEISYVPPSDFLGKIVGGYIALETGE